MSDTKNTGGAAFPAWDMTFNKNPDLFSAGTSQGMTLRDYFAAKAMAAWLSTFGDISHHPSQTDRCHLLADEAYAVADAMLKAREQ